MSGGTRSIIKQIKNKIPKTSHHDQDNVVRPHALLFFKKNPANSYNYFHLATKNFDSLVYAQSNIAYLLPPFFHLMIVSPCRVEVSIKNESCRYSMIYIKELEKQLIILTKYRTNITPNICKIIWSYGCIFFLFYLPLKYSHKRIYMFKMCYT